MHRWRLRGAAPCATQASRVVGESGIDNRVIAAPVGLVPAREVGAEYQTIVISDLAEQVPQPLVGHVRVEPQARNQRLERAVLLVRSGRPRSLHRRLRQSTHHHRQRAATVADPNIEFWMAIQDAAKDKRCHRDRFLRAEADDDVEVSAWSSPGEPSIPAGAVDKAASARPISRRADRLRAVQRFLEFGADGAPQRPRSRTARSSSSRAAVGSCIGNAASQPVRIGSGELCHCIVMATAKRQCFSQLDVMKVSQRAWRQHLKIDMRFAHLGKRNAGSVNGLPVCLTPPACNCPRDTRVCRPLRCRIRAHAGRGTRGCLQPHVRMDVDNRSVADPRHRCLVAACRLVSAHCVAAGPRRSSHPAGNSDDPVYRRR